MSMTHRADWRRAHILAYAALALSILALLLATYTVLKRSLPTGTNPTAETAMQRLQRTRVLRVAYGGFPPYTIVNPNESDRNRRVSGFTVDMIDEIARRSSPPLKVEWYNLNWGTFRADMLSGKFDIVADAVYATVPKAEDFVFTEPFSYFGLAVAVVRAGDDRFKTFKDLDRSDITIALAVGYVSTDYAKAELTKPHFKLVAVGTTAFPQMDEVLLGRADVALNDVPTVVQYVRAHPGQVKALWVDQPPSWVPASFVTRRADADIAAMLSIDIRIMRLDGTLDRLDRKWMSLGYYEQLNLKPGAGLESATARP